MSNPQKRDLTVSAPCIVKRVVIEAIGDRDQVWAHVENLDGSLGTYMNYLDEGYTVVLQQVQLLRDAVLHRDARVIFHYRDDGSANRFHSVTLFLAD